METNPYQKPLRRMRRWRRRIFWACLILIILTVALAGGLALGAWFWISQDLPRIERLADYSPPAVTRVLSADGQLMAEFFKQRRYVIPITGLSRHLVQAFVSAEDGEFFRHKGVDFISIVRAAIANLRAGRVVQGGSTITQQVARGLLLTPRKTIVRKLKEMILAWRMEKYLTKEEILYLYLNQIYLGHGAYGVEAAALTYFGISARELNLAQGALLAGLVQAPSRYSPIRHPRRARTRQVYVLERMFDDGRISLGQRDHALNRTMEVSLHKTPTVGADYYTEAVRQWLQQRYGRTALYQGGLTVYTACDSRLTQAGQKAISQGLDQLTQRQGWRGPLAKVSRGELAAVKARPLTPDGLAKEQILSGVVTRVTSRSGAYLRLGGAQGIISPEDVSWAQGSSHTKDRIPERAILPGDVVMVRLKNYLPALKTWRVKLVQEPEGQSALLALEAASGRVRVMIGGRDYSKSQFNRALQARRQPGSAFKPFIYAAAFDHPGRGMTPVSVIIDSPVVYDDPAQPGHLWKPKNYENRFYGPTTLRTALEHSRNVVTVKLLAKLGLSYTLDYTRRFGFQSQLSPNLSLALGTAGLSLLEITQGYSVFANGGRLVEPVLVERVLDRGGNVVYEANPKVKQALTPQTAFLMTHLLRGVVLHGTGRGMLSLGRPVAGKTGTTNDLRDAWFVGYSPDIICGVWVGQDDNQPLGKKETGARAAGPIWREFMGAAFRNRPLSDFTVPAQVVFARVDKESGRPLAPGDDGGFFEAFIEGSEPVWSPVAAGHSGNSEPESFLEEESFSEP